ncbi:hypothetical protein ACJJTC_000640 [Scirpophaga incertulas]
MEVPTVLQPYLQKIQLEKLEWHQKQGGSLNTAWEWDLILILRLIGNSRVGIGNEEDFTNNVIDVDLSDVLSGLVMTVFTCLRKVEHDPSGHKKYKAYIAKVGDTQISVQVVIEEVKEAKIELDFLIATPIVELMTIFKSFYDEVLTGVTRFRVRSSLMKKSVKRDARGRVTQKEGSSDNTQSMAYSRRQISY